jgi:hypothetical protein
MQRQVRSWDVFDTLLGRRCFAPHRVFELCEAASGVPNLAKLRRQAEAESDGSFAGIYTRLGELAKLSPRQVASLQELELHVERHQTYLIEENAAQVQDGDLLVSDMYLDSDQILGLLRHAGFTKDVTVIATRGGKGQGMVWKALADRGFAITQHLGDNYHSDVVSPRRAGLTGIHYADAGPTANERAVGEAGFFDLAALMRTIRLMNPYPRNTLNSWMWNEQAQINGPMLYLASLHLEAFHRPRNPYRTALFMTRDGVHWHRLHRALYPDENSHYFDASRVIFNNPTPAYLEYIKRFGDPADFILLDVHGTGSSPMHFFKRTYNMRPLYYTVTAGELHPELEAAGRAFRCAKAKSCLYETLNYDTIGRLIDYTEAGPVRTPPTHEPRLLQAYHAAIGRFIDEASRRPPPTPRAEQEAALLGIIQRFSDQVDKRVVLMDLCNHDG